MKRVFLWLPLFFCSYSSASYAYLLGGANFEVLSSLSSSNPKGDGTSARAGIFLGYGEEQYYGAAKLFFGNTDYSDKADANEKQSDVEVIAGYRITSNVSAFIGYRYRSLDFNRLGQPSLNASEKINHYGAGAAFTYPVRNELTFIADAKLYTLTSSYNSGSLKNSASGYSIGSSVGLLRNLGRNIRGNVSGIMQITDAEYTTGGTYTDTSLGFSIGINKSF